MSSALGKRMDAHLVDDLDPEAERQLCGSRKKEHGVAAVFVLGFHFGAAVLLPPAQRHHGAAQVSTCCFDGVEITTGGQRLHRRADLEEH